MNNRLAIFIGIVCFAAADVWYNRIDKRKGTKLMDQPNADSPIDFDTEFAKLTARLGDVNEPADEVVAVSLSDITETLERLQETARLMSKYVSKIVAVPRGTGVPFPAELYPLMMDLNVLCAEVTDMVHDEVCEDCEVYDQNEEHFDEDEGYLCPECHAQMEFEEGDPEDY